MPSYSLGYLRYITLIFPLRCDVHYTCEGEGNDLGLWTSTLDFIADYLLLGRLTLELQLDRGLIVSLIDEKSLSLRHLDSRSWKTYKVLVLPVRKLVGLKNFFVRVGARSMRKGVFVSHAEIEAKLERMVMGKAYDSTSRGKTTSL